MKTLEVIRVHLHRRTSLREFMATHTTLRWQAQALGETPADFLAGAFVAEINPGERYEAWVVRQVRLALETQLWRDKTAGFEAEAGTHVSRHVKRVEFDAGDVRFILDTFAGRTDVQEVWKAAHAQAWAKAA